MSTGREFSTRLRSRAEPALVRQTRRLVCEHAARAGASDRAIDSIELLSSELVTNAVRHGPPGGVVEVCARRRGTEFQVVVSDGSAEAPSVRSAGPDAGGGRGMWLVDRMAARWGVQRHRHLGKSVWFVIPLAGTALDDLAG